MDSRHMSIPPLIPPKSPAVLNKHLSQPNLMMKNRRVAELHKTHSDDSAAGSETNKKAFRSKESHRRTSSLPRRKSSEPREDTSLQLLSQKSKSLSTCSVQSPLVVIPSHLSLPVKLAKLSLAANNLVAGHDIKILVNDETEPRKDIDQMPKRPLKRKSQDHDRNFLSETGSAGPSATSDFWLPKVKVTPSMVTRLNAEILANFQVVQTSSKGTEDKQRQVKITELLFEFFSSNGFFGSDERITDAIETLSTRIISPADDELWTILTTEKVLNVKFAFVCPEADLRQNLTGVKVLRSFPLLQIRRILTDPDLSLAYLVGPDTEIVTGDSAKTEKLISSILVATLRVQKANNASSSIDQQGMNDLPMEVDTTTNKIPGRFSGSSTHHKHQRLLNSPQFLEVANVRALEIPSIRETFMRFPSEKNIFHSSAVVVRFEEMTSDLEAPVRIQVAAEGNDFRASILKLSGSTLSFFNPIRSFFTFNPGNNLTNIDVSNAESFSVKRIESPKPHSLLMVNSENYYILETGGAQVADDIFQRIQATQRNSVCGVGKQVAHIFITGQSLVAFQIHSYESIFQVPVMNVMKLHEPSNQANTCVLELDSTEAMDFISTDSPCWSLTFASSSAKAKFIQSIIHVTPHLAHAPQKIQWS